jgi:exportin-5
MRVSRLTEFINPIKDRWRDGSLTQALASFDGFCQLMGLDKAQKYLTQRHIHEIGDWGLAELDAEGFALQNELEQRQTVRAGFIALVGLMLTSTYSTQMLPLRITKSFLGYSVEKLDKNSPPYIASCVLWQDGIPVILPELLKFLRCVDWPLYE